MKKLLGLFVVACILVIVSTNICMYASTSSLINDDSNADVILVLGCGTKDGKPSLMLKDRLDKAIELYENKQASTIILSGDPSDNEVEIMKTYMIDEGMSEDVLILDNEGYSTYQSLYNAKNIYDFNNIIVVTQQYHMYRALYIGISLDMNVSGVSAQNVRYNGQIVRNVREILARTKDYFSCLFGLETDYIGINI
ncbi:MAG: YdcF family protein [Erysipelotrichaceae bacterium]|nr:YdcF family protein [Erysipelotrichaceae bacterium]